MHGIKSTSDWLVEMHMSRIGAWMRMEMKSCSKTTIRRRRRLTRRRLTRRRLRHLRPQLRWLRLVPAIQLPGLESAAAASPSAGTTSAAAEQQDKVADVASAGPGTAGATIESEGSSGAGISAGAT